MFYRSGEDPSKTGRKQIQILLANLVHGCSGGGLPGTLSWTHHSFITSNTKYRYVLSAAGRVGPSVKIGVVAFLPCGNPDFRSMPICSIFPSYIFRQSRDTGELTSLNDQVVNTVSESSLIRPCKTQVFIGFARFNFF